MLKIVLAEIFTSYNIEYVTIQVQMSNNQSILFIIILQFQSFKVLHLISPKAYKRTYFPKSHSNYLRDIHFVIHVERTSLV